MNANIPPIVAPVSAKLTEFGRSAIQSYPDEGAPNGLPSKVHVAIFAVTAALTVAMALLF